MQWNEMRMNFSTSQHRIFSKPLITFFVETTQVEALYKYTWQLATSKGFHRTLLLKVKVSAVLTSFFFFFFFFFFFWQTFPLAMNTDNFLLFPADIWIGSYSNMNRLPIQMHSQTKACPHKARKSWFLGQEHCSWKRKILLLLLRIWPF